MAECHGDEAEANREREDESDDPNCVCSWYPVISIE